MFGLAKARLLAVPDRFSLALAWTKAGVTAALARGTQTSPAARTAASTTPQ